jgi:hypothetical protein
MLRLAMINGTRDALHRLKLAGPAGADMGVMPKGDEQTHGTDRIQYAKKQNPDPTSTPSQWRDTMPDWLWDNFTTYDEGMAPGATGEFGSENLY